ncbi:MAG: hypothetical protein EB124_01715 [Betaproteobacteria bacterium]|nr:hypothetical protein [Betaproteobacteria bacterium]
MAIYELRTYDVVVGKMAEVIALYQQEGWPAIQKHPAKLVGYFTGDVVLGASPRGAWFLGALPDTPVKLRP